MGWRYDGCQGRGTDPHVPAVGHETDVTIVALWVRNYRGPVTLESYGRSAGPVISVDWTVSLAGAGAGVTLYPVQEINLRNWFSVSVYMHRQLKLLISNFGVKSHTFLHTILFIIALCCFYYWLKSWIRGSGVVLGTWRWALSNCSRVVAQASQHERSTSHALCQCEATNAKSDTWETTQWFKISIIFVSLADGIAKFKVNGC